MSGLVYTANASSRPVLSTVAPHALREILSNPGASKTQVARATIEYQLECYNNYILAPSKTFSGVPSLVDVLAAKIPQTVDGLDEIPDLILSQHIWRWHRITYPLFRKALTRLESASDGPPKKRQKSEPRTGTTDKDVDECRLRCRLPDVRQTNASRTIVRPTNLPGYQVLSGKRAPQIEIQPSAAGFKSTFDRLSDGLLKGLDWKNVFIAGGIVLGALLAVRTQPGIAAQWVSSDVEVYLYGLGLEAANAKLEHLFKTFRANLPRGTPTLVVRNSKTVTFYSRYPLRRVQVVLKLVKSPRAVLLNFDLDVCAMGWDGSELWMLPRTARALETGFNVFTMNLIQGHYLSERRATQEQRVFKYANRGYGIRILPSYVASLEESKTKLDNISRDEVLFKLDMDKIAEASRVWTQKVIKKCYSYTSTGRVSHSDLDNKHQLSAEPQGRSCLSGFSLFMRHVALWDWEQTGDLVIDEKHWASTDYGDAPDDPALSYTWGKDFNIPDFKHQIDVFNLRQITDWLSDESFLDHHELEYEYEGFLQVKMDYDEFKAAKRLTYATTAAGVLKRTHDIVLPVLLPANFAVFANQLVADAQAAAGLNVASILTPAVVSTNHDAQSGAEVIFLWRIGREMMWQQLDRRIDEYADFVSNSTRNSAQVGRVFEVLYAFYRINDRTVGTCQEVRLLTQVSKRAIRPAIEDEFDAFARWVGRQPIFVDKFYNHTVSLDRIEGQISDEEGE
ncbi:hypothetical protein C8F04DRAFT_1281023 [Mycena alexandri]|uniref:Uncharacterized protein n=1 Tax=Mycena alexandri TaxID=1745969 RepID=A0AAD6WLB7_9AGAR|nr:hypothetical protein C8F04DRAFT_1281023 [Mycena alexandri]